MSTKTTGSGVEVQAYLCFDGRTEEALEFYKKALGAEVEFLMRFKDSPEPSPMEPPNSGDKVMHSTFRIGQTALYASDGPCQGKMKFEGIHLSLIVPTAAEADRLFNALTDGGQIHMTMAKTFFAEKYGMVQDRFGVQWMVMTAK
jgi:PhnB protein